MCNVSVQKVHNRQHPAGFLWSRNFSVASSKHVIVRLLMKRFTASASPRHLILTCCALSREWWRRTLNISSTETTPTLSLPLHSHQPLPDGHNTCHTLSTKGPIIREPLRSPWYPTIPLSHTCPVTLQLSPVIILEFIPSECNCKTTCLLNALMTNCLDAVFSYFFTVKVKSQSLLYCQLCHVYSTYM